MGAAPLESSIEEFWSRLGFLVVQGYGLTETAPIVTLNHPFGTSKGSVGKPISGVDVKIAPDGEILVRGDNVSTGYYGAPDATSAAFEGGWFHTGRHRRSGSAGPAVHPRPQERNDRHARRAERVSGRHRARRECGGGREGFSRRRPHQERRRARARGPDCRSGHHARRRGASGERAAGRSSADSRRHGVAGDELPRTEGTKKLKRHEIQKWLQTGAPPAAPASHGSGVDAVIERFTGGRALQPGATLEELGLSSLERIEMMVALEEALDTSIDEAAFSNAATVADLQRLAAAPASTEPAAEPVDFPALEPRVAHARHSRREPVDLSAAACARLCLDYGRRTGSRPASAGPGDFCGQSSEPHGRPGDPGRAAAPGARARGTRDGEGSFSRRISSRSSSRESNGSPTA